MVYQCDMKIAFGVSSMCTRIVMTITTQNDSSHADAEYKVSLKNFL